MGFMRLASVDLLVSAALGAESRFNAFDNPEEETVLPLARATADWTVKTVFGQPQRETILFCHSCFSDWYWTAVSRRVWGYRR
jgi:hypothetical protein